MTDATPSEGAMRAANLIRLATIPQPIERADLCQMAEIIEQHTHATEYREALKELVVAQDTWDMAGVDEVHGALARLQAALVAARGLVGAGE